MYRKVVKSMFFALAALFIVSTLAFAADMGTVKAVDDKGMATVMVGEKEVKAACKGAKAGDMVEISMKDGKASCKMSK